jgi:hypothetical protein
MPLRSSTSGGDSRRSSLETSDGDIIQSQSPMINTVNDEVSLPTMDEVTEHVVVSSSDNDTRYETVYQFMLISLVLIS